jgi:hypothetical protein
MAKNYDYDTRDVAADIASHIEADRSYKGALRGAKLTALIERKVDEMVIDGKVRVYQKRHHIPT